MDAMIGTIIAVGFNYTPAGWLPCNGQLLSVQNYMPLFSLLGTAYGGDGQTTFGIPDLRGRTAVGSQSSASTSPPMTVNPMARGYQFGNNSYIQNSAGSATLAIGIANLPSQTLSVTLQANDVSATSVLHATQAGPGLPAPAANAMLCDTGPNAGAAAAYYVNPTPATPLTPVPLNADSVVTTIGSGTAQFTGAALGNGTPLTIPVTAQITVTPMQPSLGMNYIICFYDGDYPNRP